MELEEPLLKEAIELPYFELLATNGNLVELSSIEKGVLFFITRPYNELEHGVDGLGRIEGFKGSTVELEAINENIDKFESSGFKVYGVSSQDPIYQKEVKKHLDLNFELLSDKGLRFTKQFGLPTISFNELEFIQKLTLVVENGQIVKVFTDISHPENHYREVLDYLYSLQF